MKPHLQNVPLTLVTLTLLLATGCNAHDSNSRSAGAPSQTVAAIAADQSDLFIKNENLQTI